MPETQTKRIIITGANKGIGLAAVKAVLEADPDTYVFLGSRDRARGEAAVETVVAANAAWADRVSLLVIDVGDDASVNEAKAAVEGACPGEAQPLYGLLNNAGIGFGGHTMAEVLDVNLRGPQRVTDAFVGMIQPGGRIVHMSSGAAPNFVARCSDAVQARFLAPDATQQDIDALLDACLAIDAGDRDFASRGFGEGGAYGLSKAGLNTLTILHAREHSHLVVNACTPGLIETDLTRSMIEGRDTTPEAMGMLPPEAGTRSALRLLLGEPGGTGWYFGSDAERSPMHRYRSPGDPPYTGD